VAASKGENPDAVPIEGYPLCPLQWETKKSLDDAPWCAVPKLEEIALEAFSWTTLLTSKLTIPKSVKELGVSSFEGSGVKEVVFEEGSAIETVGRDAFKNTYATVMLPDSFNKLAKASNKHSNCDYLDYPHFIWRNGTYAYSKQGWTFWDVQTGAVMAVCKVDEEERHQLNFGEGEVEASAFKSTSQPYVITFGRALEWIGKNAFEDAAVSRITFALGGSVLSKIEAAAFKNTKNLKGAITLPNRLTEIGKSAFEGSALVEVSFEIGSDLVTIGLDAFYNTSTVINLPDSFEKFAIRNTCGTYASDAISLPTFVIRGSEYTYTPGGSGFQNYESVMEICKRGT